MKIERAGGVAAPIPENVRYKLALGAERTEKAIVVGNRDGIIEWANQAWTRVTGHALDASVHKPVSSFLENTDVSPGVVDFVATCFQQGRVCEVEIPVTTPAGDCLWIHLRVEPLFQGDPDPSDGSNAMPSDFIATATDVTERKNAENTDLAEVDLGEIARAAATRHADVLGERSAFDLCLPDDLPPVLGDPAVLDDLVSRALCRGAHAIGPAWGTVTLWSGILGYDTGPCFDGDLWRGLPEGLFAFLEIHDTGGMAGEPAHARADEPFLSLQHAHEVRSFDEARERIRALGGELRRQSHPATGTSVVILLPFCGA